MKLALVLFDWFPHGGLQRDCSRIGLKLKEQGADVHIICMNVQGNVPGDFQVHQPDLKGSSKVARRKAFTVYLGEHLEKSAYDIVMGFNRLPGLDYYFAADTCFAWKTSRERNWVYRFMPRSRQYLAFENAVFGSSSSTGIFMLSPGQKQEYLACYPDSESRMTDIPPGIEKNRMAGEDAQSLRNSCRQEFDIGDNELLLLQVGSGFSIKGVDRSLAALACLPQNLLMTTHLIIIGRDEPGSYQKQAEGLGLGKRVTFLKSRDDIPRFLQGADLLLHPSYKESAGMVILEAIVAGLPVLTTASCGYAFHVQDADAGLVIEEPFTQETLNTALLDILQNVDRTHWKENGLRYGSSGDFYTMPEHVASLILEAARGNSHDR
jgi:UDP-glucose:(heptosyl)LPS alpha-1,3-glucosyltransferase